MSSSKDLNFELLEELECPVCFEYMTSEIRMCENGHSVCSSCESVCPTCRRNLTNMRNFTLEKVAAAAIYPCINRKAGCEKTLTAGTRNDHQKVCSYQSTACAFTKLWGVNCPWTGTPSMISDHVRSEHECESTEPGGYSTFEVALQDVSPGNNYGEAFFVNDQLFFLFWKIREDTFYFAVFYAGQEKEATGFTYEFKIFCDAHKFVISDVCHSYLQEKRKVLKPGECVTIPYVAVQKFVTESDELRCVIKIGKVTCFRHRYPEQKFEAVAFESC